MSLKQWKSIVISGSYSDVLALSVSGQCKACPSGKFCNDSGLAAPTGPCMAGYLCVRGAKHPGPQDSVNGLCPSGHYCLEGMHICIVLYCIVLYCIALYCIVLYCISYSTLLYCIVLYCITYNIVQFVFYCIPILYCIVFYCIVLYCIVYSIVLYCIVFHMI